MGDSFVPYHHDIELYSETFKVHKKYFTTSQNSSVIMKRENWLPSGFALYLITMSCFALGLFHNSNKPTHFSSAENVSGPMN